MKKDVLLIGVVIATVCLFAAVGQAAEVGYVDFEFLFNAHPEYEVKNDDLQIMAEKLTNEFNTKAEAIESDEEVEELAKQYEFQLEKYAEQLRGTIVDSVRAFIAQVAESMGISVVIPENLIIIGGVDLTSQVLEAMYDSYGISVPSHLRR